MKNRKLIIIGVVILLVIFAGGYFVFSSKNSSKQPIVVEPQEVEELVVSEISPEDIGLTLTAGAGNRTVTMEIDNLEDIFSLDYELSYVSKGDIPRGVVGSIEITSKDKQIKKELILGTCSDVCHYDEDVSDIKLILKVTKTDGKVYQSEKTLEV